MRPPPKRAVDGRELEDMSVASGDDAHSQSEMGRYTYSVTYIIFLKHSQELLVRPC